jgi:plasmid stabilization system protein ParE
MATRLDIAERFHEDIDRIVAHLRTHDAKDIDVRVEEVFDALWVLKSHPLIGRPADDGSRELVIGRDARGCVVRYRYNPIKDEVDVAALRAQREAGFAD